MNITVLACMNTRLMFLFHLNFQDLTKFSFLAMFRSIETQEPHRCRKCGVKSSSCRQNSCSIEVTVVLLMSSRYQSELRQTYAINACDMILINFYKCQMLKQKISLLEASNCELQNELKERRVTCEHLSKRAYDAQVFFYSHCV